MQAAAFSLFLAEGHTIGALIHSRISLVSTNQDSIQRTEILLTAVVCALLHSTLDALICVTVHNKFLLFS